MQYDTLYKRTTTGAIQVWWQEIEDGSTGRYRTHSGKQGGKIVTSEWTQARPKNEGRSNATSPVVQAVAEVSAAYELKLKKGYNKTAEAAQASDRFQCMLADKYLDRKAKLFNAGIPRVQLYAQPKLDGVRCIANRDGLWSRTGHPIVAVPHIWEALASLFAARPELILDGELYNHDLRNDFNTIVSVVKKLNPTDEDLELSRSMVQYWVYDCIIEDQTRSFRTRFIEDFSGYGMDLAPGVVVPVETWELPTEAEGDDLYLQCLADGFEGMMVRVDAMYENKRSQNLLKRKEKLDEEFLILDIQPGEGNGAGMAKTATVQLPNGKTANPDVVGTREQLREVLVNKHGIIGKMATIEFQNWTPDGSLRFPKLKVIHNTARW